MITKYIFSLFRTKFESLLKVRSTVFKTLKWGDGKKNEERNKKQWGFNGSSNSW